MKSHRLLLSLAFMAILTVALRAEEPAPAAPAAAQDPKALASAAIQREVIQVLQTRESSSAAFGRRLIPTSYSFQLTLVNTGPEGIVASPDKVPFQITRSSGGHADGAPFLSGYYDTAKKFVLVYAAAAQKYLPAAEHPLLKAE